MSIALSLREVTKRFPGVLANDRVSMDVAERSVHGLIGENGAGKSTLMSVAAGLHRPDSGSIAVFGQPVRITSPKVAGEFGIGMVHQEFKLVPSMTMIENVILGTAEGRGRLKLKATAAKVEELASSHRIEIDPMARIRDLPVGLRQRVEILKALYGGARILIFDEPTAVLTPQEAEELFVTFRSLVAQGRTVVFISHKLREVVGVTDRVTVMRGGRVVGERETASTSEEELAELMVGRRVRLHRGGDRHGSPVEAAAEAALGSGVERRGTRQVGGAQRLVVEDLRVRSDLGQLAVRGASFEGRSGEILGIAGVAGNGQLELEQAIAGLRPLERGRILVEGKDVSHLTTRQRRELGLAYIPEDRLGQGTDPGSLIVENLIVGAHYRRPLAAWGRLRPRVVEGHVRSLIRQFEIATESPQARLRTLSGGNIQKVVVARELAGTPQVLVKGDPRVLVASQPTRGVDVGAIEYIHGRLLELREAGAAILLISFELDEILFLSDRIRVIYNGELSDELLPHKVTEREIGLLMGGSKAPVLPAPLASTPGRRA